MPTIRFPEFTEDWKHKKLSELLSESKKRNTDLKFSKDQVLSVSGELGIINQIEHLGRSYAGESVHNYHIVETNDIVYTKSPLKANPYGIIKLNKGKPGIVSTLYAVYNVKSENALGAFLDYYFSLDANTNKYLRPLVKKGAKNDMKINNSYVLVDKIFVPEIREQQKIVTFLSTIDRKIQQLNKKKDLLEKYKKGMIQKIFNQEIRFEDDNGNDFADWEERNFEEVLISLPTKQYQILTSEILEKGEFQVVDQGQKLIAGYSNNKSKLFTSVPIIVFGDHTAILKYIDFNFIVGADGTKILKNKFGNLKFFYYCLVFNNIETEGYKRHYSILKLINLQFPESLEEQTKIANFLSGIDRKINLVNQQLEKTKEYKKGLLQQMFV